MGASLRLGKLFGIPIEVNASWLIIFLLLTIVLAQQFGEVNLGWGLIHRWTVAVGMVVLFFLSVLIHELSHSVVARLKGIPVRSITLFIFGGVSRLGHEPPRPMTEFTVAVVGPLSSIALSLLFGGLWILLGAGDSTFEVILLLLAETNLMLGIFNLLPGYPLDGGRVLRAAVWGFTGSQSKATRVATRCGQTIGVLIVAGGLAMGVLLDPINGIWVALVGGFLLSVATASYRREGSKSGLTST